MPIICNRRLSRFGDVNRFELIFPSSLRRQLVSRFTFFVITERGRTPLREAVIFSSIASSQEEQGPNAGATGVPKSVGSESDFGHFRSSEQHVDGCVRLARYDILLVF